MLAAAGAPPRRTGSGVDGVAPSGRIELPMPSQPLHTTPDRERPVAEGAGNSYCDTPSPALTLTASIDMRLTEKAWLLLDFMQLLGLLWATSQAWPWPHIWLRWIRWVVWANADYFSTTAEGALNGRNAMLLASKWGSMEHYAIYALSFSAVPIVVVLVYLTISRAKPQYQHHAQAVAMFVGHVFYLPVALAVFRLYHCNSAGALSSDPSLECGSMEYLVTVLIATVLSLPLLVGLPWYSHRIVSRGCLVYRRSASDHEKFTQACEISRALGLREVWLPRQMWLCASCTLPGCHFHNAVIVCKMATLLSFTFLRQDVMLQACACFLISLFALLIAIFRTPFRLYSTNVVLFALLSLMLCYTSFGMMNALGVRSSATVDSSESLVLAVLSGVSAVVVAYAIARSALSGSTEWPSKHTLWRIDNSSMRTTVESWIATIHDANKTRLIYARSPVPRAFVSVRDLDRSIKRLRASWISARSVGSIFDIIIGDVLDLMLLFRQRATEKSIRHFHKPLDAALSEGGYEALQGRERSRALMPNMKRRFLTKMTSLRAFLGNRRLNSVRLGDGTLLDDRSDAQLKGDVDFEPMDAQEQKDSADIEGGLGSGPDTSEFVIDSIPNRVMSGPEQPIILLQRLPDMRVWSEAFLRATRKSTYEPSAADRDDLGQSLRFWSELVNAISEGRINEGDLAAAAGQEPGSQPILVEDCYSYLHMLSDASERLGLGAAEEEEELFRDDAGEEASLVEDETGDISRSFGYDL